jgi:DNA helicase-2/ATP-dependent DNA helicase PcrA
MNLLATLNPAQRAAAQTTRGAVLALAGAGTGKTHTVIARLAHLVAEGADPEKILAVTFTNKAAAELKARLKAQSGGANSSSRGAKVGAEKILACTFHSLCVHILRRDGAEIGLPPHFTIIDQSEQVAIIRKAMRHIHGAGAPKPEALLSRLSSVKGDGWAPEEYSLRAIEPEDEVLAVLYRKYQETLRLRGVTDFDDLLLGAWKILNGGGAGAAYWRDKFEFIMVDEFQDTSDLQYRIVKKLAEKSGNLCVVGDDDQSIYSWRGAAPQNILDFAQHWQGAKVVALQENYRSTNEILQVANAVIAHNSARHPKQLLSRRSGAKPRLLECDDRDNEAATIVKEIREQISRGKNPQDFAIIIRANAQSAPFEHELLAAKIPFIVIGGTSFFDHKETRDLLAFLAAIHNPRDDGALLRIINVPARGIGDKTIETLRAAASRRHQSIAQILANQETLAQISAPSAAACSRLAAQIKSWRDLAKTAPEKLVAAILADTNYQDEIMHLYDQPLEQARRMEMAREVGEDLARNFSRGGDLGEYLANAALFSGGEDKRHGDRAVKIITIHSAKGLEYPCVYIAGLEDGALPHRRSIATDGAEVSGADNIDEERRLFYVAITRARDELTLSYAREKEHGGKSQILIPSRFLAEIPEELLAKKSCVPTGAELDEIFRELQAKLRK